MNRFVVKKIVNEEYEMFDKVNNIGGRADCQDRYDTFAIMRSSQLNAWDEEILISYNIDIENAKLHSRNLLAEKYAYMTMFYDLDSFELIKNKLPHISEKTKKAVEEISAIQVKWQEELAEIYPLIANKGRAIHSYEDIVKGISFETYLKGELFTYSEDTILLYKKMIENRLADNININLEILENTVKAYGYDCIEDAEDRLGKGNKRT